MYCCIVFMYVLNVDCTKYDGENYDCGLFLFPRGAHFELFTGGASHALLKLLTSRIDGAYLCAVQCDNR